MKKIILILCFGIVLNNAAASSPSANAHDMHHLAATLKTLSQLFEKNCTATRGYATQASTKGYAAGIKDHQCKKIEEIINNIVEQLHMQS